MVVIAMSGNLFEEISPCKSRSKTKGNNSW